MTIPAPTRGRCWSLALSLTLAITSAGEHRPAHAAVAPPHAFGRVHIVEMRAVDGAYRFEPAEVTIDRDDSVEFVVVSGQPHNVAFDTTGLTAPAIDRLRRNMSNQIAPLAGPLLTGEHEHYLVSFSGLPAGRYPFYCQPHLALGMRGAVTVR